MATVQWKSIPAYAAHLADLHAEIPSADQLTRMLRSLRSPHTKTCIQLPLHCKACHAVPAQTCRVVVHQLPVLNEWLYTLASEIREVAPGKLALFGLKNDTQVRLVDDNQRVAVVLLHCLLTRHQCLQAAEGLHVLLPCYCKLFCDALRNSSSLTSLQLTNCRLTSLMIRSLVAALTSTDILAELSLESCKSPINVRAENALVTYIAKTKSLRTLSVVYVRELFRNPKALLQSLGKNTSIVRLTLSSEVLLPEQGETFRCFLAGNRTILELGLVKCHFDDPVLADKLFMAIAENSVLRKLSLRYFHLDLVASVWFWNTVARSPTLREVELPYCCWWKPVHVPPEKPARGQAMLSIMDKFGQEFRISPVVRALNKTSSLRKLTLGVNFADWEMRKLLDAVGTCESLERLVLDPFTPESLEPFCQALVETGTTEKVAFCSRLIPPSEFASALQDCGDTLRLGHYDFIDLSLEGLREITAALVLHDNVTSLKLELDCTEGEISPEEAPTIATYLSSTTALKDIYLSFYVSEGVAHTLIEGITKNSSLEKLSIENWVVSSEDINVLCKWLAASKTVYHLVYLCEGYEACTALVRGLKEVLVDSYTLTYLRLVEYVDDFDALQATRELVRRNLSLVECAVQFVLGSTEKRAARAFDMVSYHPQVAFKVGEAASLRPADVKEKLKESWRRVRLHFWQLSGIIREQLVCKKRRDGRMQIDQLGLDALQHVCSFLRISDVLEEEKEERKARKRKRRGW